MYNIQFKQYLVLFSLVFNIGLIGCVSTQPNGNNDYHQVSDVPEEQWLTDLSTFVELSLKNHPSLQRQPIRLLHKNTVGKLFSDSTLMTEVRQSLQANVESRYGLNLINENEKDRLCIELQADYAFVLSFQSLGTNRYQLTATFLVDNDRAKDSGSAFSALRSSVQYTKTITLSNSQKDNLTHNVVSFEVNEDVYDLNKVEQVANKLATSIACRYQLSTHIDFIISIISQDARLAVLRNELVQQLAALPVALEIGNEQTANSVLTLTIYPAVNNEKIALLKGHVTLASGEPINDLTVSMMINKPQALHSVFTTSMQQKSTEQLITHFFAVAPSNYDDCDRTNPWQFGEQILPNNIGLSHYGCFALKMSLNQRANAVLLTQTAEGDLLLLNSGNCSDAYTGKGLHTTSPYNYAKEQLVLELNQSSGNERIVYLASQYHWSDELQAMISDIPSMCKTQTIKATVSLDDVMAIARKDAIDVKEIVISH